MKSTIKKAKVSNEFNVMDTSDLIVFGGGTVTGLTGNATFTALPVALNKITQNVKDVQDTSNLISSGESTPNNYKLLAQYSNLLMLGLTANGHYVEDTSNLVAAGNLTKAEELILSSGYKLAKKGIPGPRNFEVYKTGSNFVHVRAKKSKKGKSLFIWNFGITTEKGKKPDTLRMVATDKVNSVFTDLTSGSIFAIQYTENELASKVKKYGYPTFSYKSDEFYIWSDFIYVVVP
jgi:hypothetical protein